MVYQDHFTKFVVLRALQRKTQFEVVNHLMEIFGTFGAPKILQSDNVRQSDNGKEFANRLGDLSNGSPLFTFTEAEADCVQRKGHLASVHSKVEQDFLTDLVKRKESGDCAKENVWTGLWYDEAKEKALFTDGSPVDFWRNKVDDSFGASALVIQNSLKCSPVAPIFIQIDIASKLSRYICKKTAINEIQDY